MPWESTYEKCVWNMGAGRGKDAQALTHFSRKFKGKKKIKNSLNSKNDRNWPFLLKVAQTFALRTQDRGLNL